MIEITILGNSGESFIILDAVGISWSSHYGETGGGFGYLKFSLPRQVGTNYPEISFGFQATVHDGVGTTLFTGQIRQIEEVSSPEGDSINVTALGYSIIAGDDEFLRAYCDKRLTKWRPSSEVPSGSFRPDQFATGSNALGIYLNATTQEVDVNGHTDLIYSFFPSEVAERVKTDLSVVLGTGVLFDGTVSSTDDGNGYVFYTDDSGEGRITAGLTLWNLTQTSSLSITAVDTGSNRITVDGSLNAWGTGDELTVYGPLFEGRIADVTGAVVTYNNPLGEGNLAVAQVLANITQKSVAEVLSNDTGADTITVTDENHITGWGLNDTIIVGAAIFEATVSTVSTAIITYTGPIGERIGSSVTGWVLHNETLNEVATVLSWTAASNQVTVDDATDITSWASPHIIKIYAGYTVSIEDSTGTVVWPASDWRMGAIAQNRTAINELTTGGPTGFTLKFSTYLGGSGNESSFAQFSNLRVYSTEDDTTPSFLAKEAVKLLSIAGHDLLYDFSLIEELYPRIIEPMVFEFTPVAGALTAVAQAGNENLVPIAWGVAMDTEKTLYMETFPQDGFVDYVVRRTAPIEISASGDVQGSWQRVRGIYTDKLGNQQVTAWLQDLNFWFGGNFRSQSVRLENVDTDAEALLVMQKYLDEVKVPKLQTSYSASQGSVFLSSGVPVSIETIRATGRLVEIEDWRVVEASGIGTIVTGWTTERLSAVEIDYDAQSANLIPGSAKSTFQSYMAELARLAQV